MKRSWSELYMHMRSKSIEIDFENQSIWNNLIPHTNKVIRKIFLGYCHLKFQFSFTLLIILVPVT